MLLLFVAISNSLAATGCGSAAEEWGKVSDRYVLAPDPASKSLELRAMDQVWSCIQGDPEARKVASEVARYWTVLANEAQAGIWRARAAPPPKVATQPPAVPVYVAPGASLDVLRGHTPGLVPEYLSAVVTGPFPRAVGADLTPCRPGSERDFALSYWLDRAEVSWAAGARADAELELARATAVLCGGTTTDSERTRALWQTITGESGGEAPLWVVASGSIEIDGRPASAVRGVGLPLGPHVVSVDAARFLVTTHDVTNAFVLATEEAVDRIPECLGDDEARTGFSALASQLGITGRLWDGETLWRSGTALVSEWASRPEPEVGTAVVKPRVVAGEFGDVEAEPGDAPRWPNRDVVEIADRICANQNGLAHEEAIATIRIEGGRPVVTTSADPLERYSVCMSTLVAQWDPIDAAEVGHRHRPGIAEPRIVLMSVWPGGAPHRRWAAAADGSPEQQRLADRLLRRADRAPTPEHVLDAWAAGLDPDGALLYRAAEGRHDQNGMLDVEERLGEWAHIFEQHPEARDRAATELAMQALWNGDLVDTERWAREALGYYEFGPIPEVLLGTARAGLGRYPEARAAARPGWTAPESEDLRLDLIEVVVRSIADEAATAGSDPARLLADELSLLSPSAPGEEITRTLYEVLTGKRRIWGAQEDFRAVGVDPLPVARLYVDRWPESDSAGVMWRAIGQFELNGCMDAGGAEVRATATPETWDAPPTVGCAEARDPLSRALDLGAFEGEEGADLVMVYQFAGRPEKAAALARSLADADPTDPAALYLAVYSLVRATPSAASLDELGPRLARLDRSDGHTDAAIREYASAAIQVAKSGEVSAAAAALRAFVRLSSPETFTWAYAAVLAESRSEDRYKTALADPDLAKLDGLRAELDRAYTFSFLAAHDCRGGARHALDFQLPFVAACHLAGGDARLASAVLDPWWQLGHPGDGVAVLIDVGRALARLGTYKDDLDAVRQLERAYVLDTNALDALADAAAVWARVGRHDWAGEDYGIVAAHTKDPKLAFDLATKAAEELALISAAHGAAARRHAARLIAGAKP